MHPDRLIAGVLVAVAVIGLAHIAAWVWLESRRAHRVETPKPRKSDLAIGFVANFFDTLGVGSFATTTAAWRLRGLVPDELIPGTLNVGHALPTIAQALIFIAAVTVDPVTLLAMIGAAVAGALLGAPVVARLPKRGVQVGMGVALLVAAVLFLLAIFKHIPGGGDAIGLVGSLFWIGLAGNFVLGALMTLGIGLYGPCLILVSLLGMNPIAAFPIMMGSCAFLMPAGSLAFVARGRYSLRAAIGLALGGIPGVLVAAYVVKSLPLDWLRWLVVVVVVYAAVGLLRSAARR
ncbi:MAG: TSUP family transporter [Steroidobacteraceae bacterium]